MLQRAASNAYSWWWASHIRTKQSKWLDTDLQEMEERVKSMLKIIEEDGDSFARKAEMYFKKRPELVSIVEETYKAYRALAEKYDHVSGELHKANHTIATAFPDQIHLDMQDSEDDNLPKAITSIGTNHVRRPSIEIPRISLTNTRKETPTFLKKSRLSRAASQNNKDKAQEEIDKLQKAILVLQTEKEYIKSSYESGVAKYWEIEKQINEMQEEVSSLQDKFSISVVIEDDEARGLMAVAALRSCEDSLFKLQEQQKLSMEEAKIGSERIKIAKEMIETETDKVEFDQSEEVYKISNNIEEDEHSFESEPICGNSKISSDTSVVELAEKINELVAKVVSFELTASSQTAKLRSMQSEIDLLHSHIQSFEEEKKALTDDSSSLPDELKQAEEEPQRRQDQVKCERGEQSVKSRISTVENILDDNAEGEVISLQNENVRRDCQIKAANEIPDTMANVVFEESGGTHEPKALLKDLGCFDHSELQINSLRETNNIHQSKESEPEIELILDHSEAGSQLKEDSINCLSKIEEVQISSSLADDNFYPSNEPKVEFEKQEVEISSSQKDYHSTENVNIQSNKESNLQSEDQEISLNWLQSLVNGLEGKEKIILAEYTVILRNYKDIKKKLSEVEKENQEYLQGITKQIRELKSANAMKDEEIYSLRRNLRSLQLKSNENANAQLQKPTSVLQNTQMSELLEVSDAISTDGLLHTNSAIEEKFRREIDASLEENLEFWLRFSSSFQNIQNFQTTFEDLQAEIEKSKSPGSLPFEKTLRELKTELQVWLEQNILLRGELESKVSSLGSLQEEISGALEASLEADDVEFAPYQAAKLQGELLNIQLENNKVAEELKAGLDHVRMMQAEVEKTISILQGKIILSEVSESISTNHEEFKPASPKNRIPLRAFLFGTKPKKKSMFSRVNPALLKRTSRSS